ncbi:MAG: hypothetical protein NXI30_20815 [bacterium]|nr:hypothetical protein [bacterium]
MEHDLGGETIEVAAVSLREDPPLAVAIFGGCACSEIPRDPLLAEGRLHRRNRESLCSGAFMIGRTTDSVGDSVDGEPKLGAAGVSSLVSQLKKVAHGRNAGSDPGNKIGLFRVEKQRSDDRRRERRRVADHSPPPPFSPLAFHALRIKEKLRPGGLLRATREQHRTGSVERNDGVGAAR